MTENDQGVKNDQNQGLGRSQPENVLSHENAQGRENEGT